MRNSIQKYIIPVIVLIVWQQGCNELPAPPIEEIGPVWMIYKTNPLGPVAGPSLVGNSIRAIAIGADNAKYIATDEGVSLLRGSVWLTIRDPLLYYLPGDSWRHYQINAVAIGADGKVWYGLAGGGIRRSSQGETSGQFDSVKVPDLTSNMVYCFASGFDGSMWVGTAHGVCRYILDAAQPSGGRWIQYNGTPGPIPIEPIHSIGMNPGDYMIWIGTYTQGLVVNDGDFDWNYILPTEYSFPILSMAFDYPDAVWFGTGGDRAYRYDLHTDEWTHIGNDTSSGNPTIGYMVNAVAVLNHESILFGTDRGLAKYQKGGITIIDTSNSPLPSNVIRALALDEMGNVWIGTDNGLAEYNAGGIR